LVASEIRMVENIKGFPPELKTFAFSKLEALAHRHIEVCYPAQAQVIASAGAFLLQQRFTNDRSGIYELGRPLGTGLSSVALPLALTLWPQPERRRKSAI
jgi:hypothetical protein